MQPLLLGFVDELTKHAKDDAPSQGKNYMESMLVGAAAAPLLAIVGKSITRMMRNKDIEAAMSRLGGGKRRELAEELHVGPTIGRERFDLPKNQRPLLTPAELVGDAAKGALGSSVLQAVRDQLTARRSRTDRR